MCVFSVVTVLQNTHVPTRGRGLRTNIEGYPQTFVRIVYSVVHFSANTGGDHYDNTVSLAFHTLLCEVGTNLTLKHRFKRISVEIIISKLSVPMDV